LLFSINLRKLKIGAKQIEYKLSLLVFNAATVTEATVVLVLSARTISAKKWDEGVPFL